MSIKALSTVWEASLATGVDLLVLLALADYTNDKTWWAWPSIDSLAQKSRVSRRTVIRVLDRLESDIAEIMIDRNSGPNGVNRYQLTLGSKGQITNPPTESKHKTGGDCQSPVTTSHGDKHDVGLAHNPLGTGREREYPEIPPMDRAAFDALAEMRGVPKDCAEWFWNTNDARNWLDATGQPIRKVEPLLLNAAVWWRARASRRADTLKPPAVNGKKAGVWELRQRIEGLKKRAANHEANETSSARCGEPTPEEVADYEKICQSIAELERQIEEGVIA